MQSTAKQNYPGIVSFYEMFTVRESINSEEETKLFFFISGKHH